MSPTYSTYWQKGHNSVAYEHIWVFETTPLFGFSYNFHAILDTRGILGHHQTESPNPLVNIFKIAYINNVLFNFSIYNHHKKFTKWNCWNLKTCISKITRIQFEWHNFINTTYTILICGINELVRDWIQHFVVHQLQSICNE